MALPSPSLSAFSGEFLDAVREAAFQAERLSETVRHARLLFLLSAILNTLFFASDWRFHGDPHFFVAIPARAVVVAVSLACWAAVKRSGSFRHAQAAMIAWQWINGAAVAALVSSRSELALFVVLMLPSIYYLVVPTAFRWSLISGVGCSAMMLAGYLLAGPLPSTTTGLVLAMFMLNSALALVVLRSNRLRRLEWVATQAERRAKEDLAESQRMVESMLMAVPIPLVVTAKSDGRLIKANDAAYTYFGADPVAVGIHSLAEVYADPAARAALLMAVETGGRVGAFETRVRLADGSIHDVLLAVTGFHAGGTECLMAGVVDISARKQSEEDTQAARRAAETALDDLRQAQSRLIQSEKLASLGALVAGVAHEANTPIGIVLTTSTFLTDRQEQFRRQVASGRLNRSDLEAFLNIQDEGLGLIVTNIQRAADLIQSFKQVAADQTSEVRRIFDLESRLRDQLFTLSPAWKRSGHRVEVECPPGIAVDGYPGALSQALSNLVMNALVHAYPEGRIGTLRIAATAPDYATVELVFEDDGRGIPAADLEHVFEPFFTTRRSAGSTGLGLHIVHNLVTGALGGTIAVTSRPNAGTRFTIRFPRVSPEAAGVPDANPKAPARSPSPAH
ncbi:sensor histidine kinase [Azospirillum sp. sgz301742]